MKGQKVCSMGKKSQLWKENQENADGEVWPHQFLRRKEVEYPKGRGVFGSARLRRRCCCWKIAEPAHSCGGGDVQPVSAPAKGFGLGESHTGSFTSLCAPPQQGSVTTGFIWMFPRLTGCSGSLADLCCRVSSVKWLFLFWLWLAGYLDMQILVLPL